MFGRGLPQVRLHSLRWQANVHTRTYKGQTHLDCDQLAVPWQPDLLKPVCMSLCAASESNAYTLIITASTGNEEETSR